MSETARHGYSIPNETDTVHPDSIPNETDTLHPDSSPEESSIPRPDEQQGPHSGSRRVHGVGIQQRVG